jgi:hypothetical protein
LRLRSDAEKLCLAALSICGRVRRAAAKLDADEKGAFDRGACTMPGGCGYSFQ